MLEDAGSYGAGLARELEAASERVAELERPARPSGQGHGKSDRLDAVRAARAALADERLAEPRARGAREALRVLFVAREGAVATGRAGRDQLRALVLVAPE